MNIRCFKEDSIGSTIIVIVPWLFYVEPLNLQSNFTVLADFLIPESYREGKVSMLKTWWL